jgi:hypothetical protein
MYLPKKACFLLYSGEVGLCLFLLLKWNFLGHILKKRLGYANSFGISNGDYLGIP